MRQTNGTPASRRLSRERPAPGRAAGRRLLSRRGRRRSVGRLTAVRWDYFTVIRTESRRPRVSMAVITCRPGASGHSFAPPLDDFDPRSFRINDEISVAIYDRGVAEELAAAFEADVQHSEEWTLGQWNGRSLMHRVTDRFSVLLKRQL